jgi:hypothetical protein
MIRHLEVRVLLQEVIFSLVVIGGDVVLPHIVLYVLEKV